MTTGKITPNAPLDPGERTKIQRLMVFFALVYVAEGTGQIGGLIAQPLNYYLKQVFGWTPVQITVFLTALTFPWFIKPLYGIISDFVPLFGYRRKTYLVLANALAAIAFLMVVLAKTPGHLLIFLMLTAYGMAISSTLCGAVLVENGQKFRSSGAFVSQQWLWFNIAGVAAALIGGLLVQELAAGEALHIAAAIIGIAPLGVVLGSWFLVTEENSNINIATLKKAFHAFIATFKSKPLWIIALFIFFYNFSPGFATPLYFYMTDTLKFSQGYIGILGSVSAGGWIAGAFIHRYFLKSLTSRNLLVLSILLGVAATLFFLFLTGEVSAAIVNFLSGIAAMIAYVASLTLAADFCPKQSEAFAYAIIMSIANLAGSASDNAGSLLYEHVFHNRLTPLIWASAVFTGFSFILIPILNLGSKSQGEPVAAIATEVGADSEHSHISLGR